MLVKQVQQWRDSLTNLCLWGGGGEENKTKVVRSWLEGNVTVNHFTLTHSFSAHDANESPFESNWSPMITPCTQQIYHHQHTCLVLHLKKKWILLKPFKIYQRTVQTKGKGALLKSIWYEIFQASWFRKVRQTGAKKGSMKGRWLHETSYL